MQTDKNEPQSVVSLDYRQENATGPWHSLIRVFAILCILDGAAKCAVEAITTRYAFNRQLRPLIYGVGIWFQLSIAVLVLQMLFRSMMVMGGIGCLYRKDSLRRLTVLSCWSVIAADVVYAIKEIVIYLGRGVTFGDAIATATARILGVSLLPLAIAILFSNRGVKNVFEGH